MRKDLRFYLLGFDPGRDKCGLAVMTMQGELYDHRVVSSSEALSILPTWCDRYRVSRVIMGNQTTAKQWQAQIRPLLSQTIPIILVDERYSSLEARDRYWQMYPPRWWQRLIPQGMRLPPRPVDDIVAILLLERYLAQNNQEH